ncbi:MAG: DUF4743 domain-containing protein [Rhodospirillaceae bacterium]|nr:DUF4743 domain-containing protein [Rhodospirillaceae bacterium]
MSFLDKIKRCNARDLARYRPFLIEGARFGFVTPERCAGLTQFGAVFDVRADHVTFAPPLDTVDKRTQALAAIVPELSASGAFLKPSGELYGVKNNWAEPEQLRIDRALVPGFGFRAFGVHVNGFVRRPSGIHLWIGTRAMSCRVEPGKLDNMVAGGQPAHLSLMDNLVKECGEEAGLDESFARQAQPTGTITYSFDAPEGLKVDTLFCFDLEMPEAVVPINRDGEISSFELVPLNEILAGVRETSRFKFNVNLVIIDFAIRHGIIGPTQEPDLEAIIAGLHESP